MALSRCYSCLVRPDLLSLSSDFITIQGKQPPETPEKIWEQSNGRIKSYGSFESLLWFGMTTPTRHRPTWSWGGCVADSIGGWAGTHPWPIVGLGADVP